ncbi:MAG: hypothetical protein K6E30_08270 [Lachnospiraceae bacterium]|nr:hypothetical protein [Lachnospiraceae bacterium]
MKANTMISRIPVVFLLVFALMTACFPLSVSAYTPEDFVHRDNKDAGQPTTLVGSSDFEPLGVQGQAVWSLSSIKMYKSWWVTTDADNNITDEFANWDFTDLKIDENGVSFTMTMYGEQSYKQIVRAPGAVPVLSDGFLFITVDGGMDDDPSGWISVGVNGAGRDTSEWYSSYDDSVSIGTSTTLDGRSARSHDFTSIIPEPQVGMEPLHFMVNSAYWGIDFIYTVPEPAAPIVQNSTSGAETAPGEDSGVDIIQDILERPEITPYPYEDFYNPVSTGNTPSAAAVSVIGAIAAAGALGAGTGKGGRKKGRDKKEEEKKQKRYKMYVRKDFGDAIQKGAKAVYVYARVTEIVEGRESDCPEQTKLIQVSGRNLIVKPGGIEGRCMRAEVSAPAESAESQGTVTFTLSGPGGVFRRNIIFRIIGEPRIAFPGDAADGRSWDLSYENNEIEMVAGKGGFEKLRFVLLDAVTEPKDIRFLQKGGFDIEREKDAGTRFTYYACIRNNTAPLEKKGGIFGEIEERRIVIEAEFPDGLIIQGGFTIKLYPDGLSVLADPKKIENDRLIVDTVANPDVSPGYSPINPVFFEILACYVDARTEKAVIERNPSYRRRALDDDGKYGLLFKENFEYEMNFSGSTAIVFTPKTTLPMLEDPYLASMKLVVEEQNVHMEGDLPFAFYGEQPLPPNSVEWEQAYERLKKDIRIFGVGDDPTLKVILHNARNSSAADLETARKAVIKGGVLFYQEFNNAEQEFANLCTRYILVAGTMVHIGDKAVEMILIRCIGQAAAPTAAAIINPMKNMLATYMGTYYACGTLKDAPNFFDTILSGCQDALAGIFTGEERPTPQTLGYVVSGYLMVCYIRHYRYGQRGEKGDVYLSITAAVGDLTFEGFKMWVSDVIKKGSTSLINYVGNLCGNIYKKIIAKSANKAIRKAASDAFNRSVRSSIGSSGVLTTGAYNMAKEAKMLALDNEIVFQNSLKNNTADYINKTVVDNLMAAYGYVEDQFDNNFLAGQILNYLIGGTKGEGDSLGKTPTEVLWGYLTDRLGLKVAKIWDSALNPLQIECRLGDNYIILAVAGLYAAIPLSDNISAFLDIAFSFSFGWMETLWNKFAKANEMTSRPDLLENAPLKLETLEQQKERLENLPSLEYKPQK